MTFVSINVSNVLVPLYMFFKHWTSKKLFRQKLSKSKNILK